ncbi:MAG TPA: phage portal protein, partial [Clostridia bacterium]|nr:phage portal protein [Clostridia bacterium]
MITIKANTLDRGVPSWEAVRRCVREFEAGLPRLARLARYYEGRHDILARTRLPGLPNVRISHAWPRYIAQVSAAYLLGEPVRLEGPEPAAASLRDLLNHAGADSIDMELALQQAVFGRAVSLCYENAAGQPCACAPDPRSAFVVYDDTVERQPLMGVLLSQERDAQGRPAGGSATVYLPQRSLR